MGHFYHKPPNTRDVNCTVHLTVISTCNIILHCGLITYHVI